MGSIYFLQHFLPRLHRAAGEIHLKNLHLQNLHLKNLHLKNLHLKNLHLKNLHLKNLHLKNLHLLPARSSRCHADALDPDHIPPRPPGRRPAPRLQSPSGPWTGSSAVSPRGHRRPPDPQTPDTQGPGLHHKEGPTLPPETPRPLTHRDLVYTARRDPHRHLRPPDPQTPDTQGPGLHTDLQTPPRICEVF
ncbi:hypothetical protein EYF80_057575 [Liparis tanakae]|uniref:Uncharacterized protein n=1 Tax=Liparis tanakae TaxID=230148 RepID=A0A4Z2ETY6_9TELE|nr:hypothetical protein EYF80_057575 [Liparis tanakae]